MAAKKKKSGNSMDTGTKVVIGLLAVALLLAMLGGRPDNDAWDGDDPPDAEAADGAGSSAEDDPWTRGAPPDDDGDDDVVTDVDDPWTRGAPPPDDGDDEVATDVDDPWTRGPSPRGRSGLRACQGVTGFPVDEGTVSLPIDSDDDAFASPDCTFARGQSDESVLLLQAALNRCNGQAVAADGIYGLETRQAVATVQAQHGVAADGAYGPDTREAMAWPTDPDGGASACITGPDVG